MRAGGCVTRRIDFREAVLPAVVLVAAFAYLAAARRLGWWLEDEGVLYYQYLRVHQGQVPYRDFFTGYAPLTYYFHAWAFSLLGVSIGAIRLLLAAVHAITAAGLYLIGRRLATRGFALVPPALFVVLEPNGMVGTFSVHNIPYPTWYALAFSILGTWTLLRAGETGHGASRHGWLVASGLLGGVALLFKQNAGLFFLLGAGGFLASWPGLPAGSPARERPELRLVRSAFLASIPLAALGVVHRHLVPATVGLFVAPLALLALQGALRAFDASAWRRLFTAALCVVGGVALAVGPWLAFFAAVTGLRDFVAAVFPSLGDVEQNLYVGFPAPGAPTLLMLPALALFAAGLWWRGTRGATGGGAAERSRAPLLLGLAAAACALLWLSWRAVAAGLAGDPQPLRNACAPLGGAVDNALAYGTFVVLGAALWVLVRQRRGILRASDPRPDALCCVTWIGACLLLAYYPRMDMAHLVGVLPPLYVLAAALAASGVRRLEDARKAQPGGGLLVQVLRVACVLAVVSVLAVKALPMLELRVELALGSGTDLQHGGLEPLGLDRAALELPVRNADERRAVVAFRALVHHILRITRPDEAVFTFPALSMVGFLTGRPNPTRHDYFLGDNVGAAEQERVIQTLEDAHVGTVAITEDPTNYFVVRSRPYTAPIRTYLQAHFEVDRRFGLYTVLRRRRAP